jgi:predicted lysophospholipase L1 biosynthesis ABC-type transport system permease subunit
MSADKEGFMRGVSRRFRQFAMLLALFTVLVAQTAVAKERDRRLVDRFERAKRFIVELLGRLSPPPGDEDEDEESGRLSPPPGDS